jgi:ADP-ribose pyrophosphatase YjhB (NUDIX family)
MSDRQADTARGIIQKQHSILLMERWRDDLHYFSIPGGHMEVGESPEETVVREVFEETGVVIKTERHVLLFEDSGENQ